MSDEPLKPLPCPWCQSSDIDIVHVDIRQKNGQMVCMRCCGCGVTGPIETVENPNHEEPVAIAAWNQREPIGNPDELPGWVKEKITIRRRELDRHIGNEFVKNTFECGMDAALKWVLSLRREDAE